MLVKVRVALAAPVVAGLKVTVNGTLSPAGMVTGNERPLTLNTDSSLVLAAVTVTLAPLAVSVPDAVPLVPTTTLPTPRVVGLTASCPAAAAVPVPESGIVSVELEALDVMVTLPLALPVDVGANATLKLVLWPAVKVTGAVIPLSVNPLPLIAT